MRYKNLEGINPKQYEKLYIENMNNAKERYEYYYNLSKKNEIELEEKSISKKEYI